MKKKSNIFHTSASGCCIKFIDIYQKYISPMFPSCCRFHPTCSLYGRQAIERFGAFSGGWLFLKRIVKCHPFTGQSTIIVDPVPRSLKKNEKK